MEKKSDLDSLVFCDIPMVMGLATGTKVLVGMTLHTYLVEEIF